MGERRPSNREERRRLGIGVGTWPAGQQFRRPSSRTRATKTPTSPAEPSRKAVSVDTYGAHLAEGLSALRGAPATSKRRGENRRSAQARIVRGAPSTPSVAALSELLAEAVYFVRTSDDLVKIGHTTNVAARIAAHGGWSTVLAIVPGTYADEQALHAGLRPFLARGREYYRPDAAIFDHVDGLRETMGLSPVTRW